MKFVKIAQTEMAKRIEIENSIIADRNQLKCELEKQQEHTKNLEIRLFNIFLKLILISLFYS